MLSNILPQVKPFTFAWPSTNYTANWSSSVPVPRLPSSKPRVAPKDVTEALAWLTVAKRDVVHFVDRYEVVWMDDDDHFVADGVFFLDDPDRGSVRFAGDKLWLGTEATRFAALGHTQFAWRLEADGTLKELPEVK